MKKNKVSDYSEQIRGVSYKPDDLHDGLNENSMILLRANNISDGEINLEDIVYVDKSKVSEKQLLRKGDILVCASSGSKHLVGKAAQVEFNGNYTFGAFCKVVRPVKINSCYLGMYFQSSEYRKIISSISQGANINNIKNENIDNLLIKVPDESKQINVAEILTNVSKIIKLKRQQLDLLDELIKSRFVEMFGDLKLNTKGWKILEFKEFAIIDTKMVKDFDKYANYPHIGIDSIEKETGELKGYRTVAEDGVISGKYLFTQNHIIYSKIRPNLNKVAMPKFEGVCSADAYPILPKKDICTREYLGYTMRNDVFLSYILAFSSRTNLPKVNKNQVEGFSVPVPPRDIQNQFTAFVQQVDKLKVEVQKSLNETQLLFDSLMQKYYE